MSIYLQETSIDPWAALSEYQAKNSSITAQYGATNVFIGTMRDMNLGSGVCAMYLEHYPAMTLQFLQKIESEAVKKYQLLDSLLIHRFGNIQPNDTIVVVASWAAHRDAAFEASRFMLEALKHQAPFWKRETLDDTGKSRWLNANTPSGEK